jgi:MFS family permease
VNYFREEGKAKIDPNIIGAVNTGMYLAHYDSSSKNADDQAYTVGGIVTGFLITPTLSKYLGRRFCIQLGLAIVIVSTFVQAFAPNMPAFIAGRLLMGMGQGLAVPTGPTYIAETAPAKVRGTMMSFWQGEQGIRVNTDSQ